MLHVDIFSGVGFVGKYTRVFAVTVRVKSVYDNLVVSYIVLSGGEKTCRIKGQPPYQNLNLHTIL